MPIAYVFVIGYADLTEIVKSLKDLALLMWTWIEYTPKFTNQA